MKPLALLFILFCTCSVYAQEKKVTFTKELRYEMPENERGGSNAASFTLLGNAEGEFLISIHFNAYPITLFSKGYSILPVTVALNSKLIHNSSLSYYMGSFPAEEKENSAQTAEVINLNTKAVVQGISCNNYLLSFGNAAGIQSNEASREEIQLCIDDKNAVNTVPLFTGILNQMQHLNLKNIPLKGLILKAGSPKRENFLTLKNISDIQESAFIDVPKITLEEQKNSALMLASQTRYQQEYEHLADSAMTAVDAAAEDYAMVSPEADEEEEVYLEKYESVYKKRTGENNYAIADLPSEKWWSILPKHCRTIDTDLPKLENTAFTAHLKNYTSQLCDLYVSQATPNNVGVKSTIDDVRREMLYFNDTRTQLSTADKRKVNSYFKNLD